MLVLDQKMFRVTRYKRLSISNRLAFVAAIMLVISALAGMGNLPPSGQNAASQIAERQASLMDHAVSGSSGSASGQTDSGFKMSLFLFRNN